MNETFREILERYETDEERIAALDRVFPRAQFSNAAVWEYKGFKWVGGRQIDHPLPDALPVRRSTTVAPADPITPRLRVVRVSGFDFPSAAAPRRPEHIQNEVLSLLRNIERRINDGTVTAPTVPALVQTSKPADVTDFLAAIAAQMGEAA